MTTDPLPDLIHSARSKVAGTRLAAVKALGKLGNQARDALPVLTQSLDDPDRKVRESAAAAIAAVGPSAVPTLIRMLSHADKYVRRNAVWGLGRLGPSARHAVPHLCVALTDADPRTAGGAAQALGSIGEPAADAVPALAEAMRGTNVVLCRLAAKALSQIGTPALPTLLIHLSHHDPFVRGEAAVAVGWIGPPAAGAVLSLLDLLTTPRGSRAETPPPMRTATPATGIPLQPNGAPSADDTCRANVAQALGRIGSAAAIAVAALERTGATDPVATVREAARLSARQIRAAVAGEG